MKKTYMIPALNVRKISLENMIATSTGPQMVNDTAADATYGMDVKEDAGDWGDEW